MLWDGLALICGGVVWLLWSDRGARLLARRRLAAMRGFLARRRRARGPLARVVALCLLVFGLRWITIFAHYGLEDGLNVLSGDALTADEETCEAHQRRVHARIVAARSRAIEIGHRGGRVERVSAQCPSTARTLRIGLTGRLHCSVHGRDDSLPPVLP